MGKENTDFRFGLVADQNNSYRETREAFPRWNRLLREQAERHEASLHYSGSRKVKTLSGNKEGE